MDRDIYIKFDFEKELSPEYIKKLKTLCASDESIYWNDKGDSCFEFQRAWDGEYVKLLLSGKTQKDINHMPEA